MLIHLNFWTHRFPSCWSIWHSAILLTFVDKHILTHTHNHMFEAESFTYHWVSVVVYKFVVWSRIYVHNAIHYIWLPVPSIWKFPLLSKLAFNWLYHTVPSPTVFNLLFRNEHTTILYEMFSFWVYQSLLIFSILWHTIISQLNIAHWHNILCIVLHSWIILISPGICLLLCYLHFYTTDLWSMLP